MADTTPTAETAAVEQAETVESSAGPTTVLDGWAALRHVVNLQVPNDLNTADALLTEALQILAQ